MGRDDGCHICGDCWWVNCPNPADYSDDVVIKRHGSTLYEGEIDLCAGHARYWRQNGGRLDLNWLAIEQALALQKARA